jgi:hypothetical protein
MGRHVTTMTIYDVDHYSDAEREQIIASYPAHEREARAKGIPTLGSGRIFPVPEESIIVAPFAIPAYWRRITGMDFGWDHPTAAAWLAHDADTDTIYLYADYAESQTLLPVHAAAIKARGDWIPVAWPHDGYQVKDALQGDQLAEQYRKAGVKMLPEHAQFEPAASDAETKQSVVSVEAGLQEMLTRMTTGRFKVFSTCQKWLGEFRMYHRKDGVVVKLLDDVISASRYGMMMLRYAETEPKKAADWAGLRKERSNWRT